MACNPAERPLEIATTTSVINSGLLDYVTRGFPDAQPRIHAAGSGRSLAMLSDGVVDLAISHAPMAEARALSTHRGWRYRKLAYNYFVIVGPGSDPAQVRLAGNAVEAFRRIAAHGARFVSRGDESGTHERELALWDAAHADRSKARVLIGGGGMATTLRQADELSAYTLSDDATWAQLRDGLKLRLLLMDERALLNTYAVIYDNDSPLAVRFATWLTSDEGRRRIATYRINNHQAFAVWPRRCPDSMPAALPVCD